MDAHLAALQKTMEYIGGEDILEVAYRVPFGFHEISNRKNISVEDFLRDSYQEKQKVIVLHILLGCGVQLEKFVSCVNKAVSLGERVLVLEHNKWSADWDWSNDFEVKDHCLNNCLAYDEFIILRELYGWESFRGSPIEGTRSVDRNFIVEIFGGMTTANRWSVVFFLRESEDRAGFYGAFTASIGAVLARWRDRQDGSATGNV